MQKYTIVKFNGKLGIVIDYNEHYHLVRTLSDGCVHAATDSTLDIVDDQVGELHKLLVLGLDSKGFMYEIDGKRVYGIYRLVGVETLDVLLWDDTILFNLGVQDLLSRLKRFAYY